MLNPSKKSLRTLPYKQKLTSLDGETLISSKYIADWTLKIERIHCKSQQPEVYDLFNQKSAQDMHSRCHMSLDSMTYELGISYFA